MENKNVAVWDCTFYVTDDDGNELLNDDGTIKMFDIPNMDWSYVSEFIEFEDLEEVKNDQTLKATIKTLLNCGVFFVWSKYTPALAIAYPIKVPV